MELGPTIAVFCVVSAVLMLGFCLLLRYYSLRVRRQQREAVNMDAMNESIYRSNEEMVEGAYSQFRERRQLKRSTQMKRMHFQEDQLIQNSELRQVMDITNDIYGITQLRRSLTAEIPIILPETTRSIASTKSFNISRLNTTESEKDRHYFPYAHKIVGYSARGLSVVEARVTGIRKVGGAFELIKDQDQIFIQDPAQSNFLEQLEAYGFYPLAYAYHKYVHSADVTDLKDNQSVPLKALKTLTKKETITEEEFLRIKQEMRPSSK